MLPLTPVPAAPESLLVGPPREDHPEDHEGQSGQPEQQNKGKGRAAARWRSRRAGRNRIVEAAFLSEESQSYENDSSNDEDGPKNLSPHHVEPACGRRGIGFPTLLGHDLPAARGRRGRGQVLLTIVRSLSAVTNKAVAELVHRVVGPRAASTIRTVVRCDGHLLILLRSRFDAPAARPV